MNQASFSIRKSILLMELLNIAKVLGRISKWNRNTVLELTVTDGKLQLIIPGIKIYLDCETKNTSKATINFFHFLDIIKTHKAPLIYCVITENTMNIDNILITIQTTFFENDRILRSIKLPLNYTDWHILQLQKEGYTKEEIEFNKMNIKIKMATKTLNSNIKKTIEILKLYGVNKNDIEELVNKKMNLKN